jgi:protein SCO1/2
MINRNYLAPILAGAAALAAVAAIFASTAIAPSSKDSLAGAPAGCVLGDLGRVGGPISLVDSAGAPVTEQTFAGKPALVYFGFTFCPDICPLSMQAAKAALDAAGPDAEVVQPLLISLDPERDTPEAMASYVKAPVFPAKLQGLTGTPEQTAAAAKAFAVAWRKREDPGSAAAYTLDHSSYFYLMDSQWRVVAMYPSKFAPKDAAACIKAGLNKP